MCQRHSRETGIKGWWVPFVNTRRFFITMTSHDRFDNRQIDCLFNSLFGLASKEVSTLLFVLKEGNSPHKGPVMRRECPCHDAIILNWPIIFYLLFCTGECGAICEGMASVAINQICRKYVKLTKIFWLLEKKVFFFYYLLDCYSRHWKRPSVQYTS